MAGPVPTVPVTASAESKKRASCVSMTSGSTSQEETEEDRNAASTSSGGPSIGIFSNVSTAMETDVRSDDGTSVPPPPPIVQLSSFASPLVPPQPRFSFSSKVQTPSSQLKSTPLAPSPAMAPLRATKIVRRTNSVVGNTGNQRRVSITELDKMQRLKREEAEWESAAESDDMINHLVQNAAAAAAAAASSLSPQDSEDVSRASFCQSVEDEDFMHQIVGNGTSTLALDDSEDVLMIENQLPSTGTETDAGTDADVPLRPPQLCIRPQPIPSPLLQEQIRQRQEHQRLVMQQRLRHEDDSLRNELALKEHLLFTSSDRQSREVEQQSAPSLRSPTSNRFVLQFPNQDQLSNCVPNAAALMQEEIIDNTLPAGPIDLAKFNEETIILPTPPAHGHEYQRALSSKILVSHTSDLPSSNSHTIHNTFKTKKILLRPKIRTPSSSNTAATNESKPPPFFRSLSSSSELSEDGKLFSSVAIDSDVRKFETASDANASYALANKSEYHSLPNSSSPPPLESSGFCVPSIPRATGDRSVRIGVGEANTNMGELDSNQSLLETAAWNGSVPPSLTSPASIETDQEMEAASINAQQVSAATQALVSPSTKDFSTPVTDSTNLHPGRRQPHHNDSEQHPTNRSNRENGGVAEKKHIKKATTKKHLKSLFLPRLGRFSSSEDLSDAVMKEDDDNADAAS